MPPPPRDEFTIASRRGNDNTTLFGWLGIALAIGFWPAGIVFSILSVKCARRYGKPMTLGICGLVLCVIAGIILAIRVLVF